MTDTDDRVLDIAIAQLLGWRWVEEGDVRYLRRDDRPGFAVLEANSEQWVNDDLLAYSTDIKAAQLAEDEIERRLLYLEYVEYLMSETGADAEDGQLHRMWALLRATPEQRCRAALRAAGGSVER